MDSMEIVKQTLGELLYKHMSKEKYIRVPLVYGKDFDLETIRKLLPGGVFMCLSCLAKDGTTGEEVTSILADSVSEVIKKLSKENYNVTMAISEMNGIKNIRYKAKKNTNMKVEGWI